MADDKKNRRRKSFKDINREYDFLDKGVDQMEKAREEKAQEARRRRRERDQSRSDIDQTQELSLEEIEAQIEEMRRKSPSREKRSSGSRQRTSRSKRTKRKSPRSRQELIRKRRRRNRFILFGGGAILLLAIFLVVSFALRNDKKEIEENEIQQSEEQTQEDIYESSVTGQLEKFSRTNKRTILFREPSENSEQLFNVDKDQYVENYGVNEQFTKVIYMGEVGYIATIDLSDIEDERMFKISNGYLIANEDYYLPSDYSPGLNKDARSAFDIMSDAARQDEVNLRIASDFRSYDQQKILFDQTVSELGEAAAKRKVRAPGHSEAQAGLIFEIMGEDYDTKTIQEFDDTEESRWLKDNAYKYGFVLRHPQNKEGITGMDYQPWTYIYVGVQAAKEMTENNLAYEEFVGLSGRQENPYTQEYNNEDNQNQDDGQNEENTDNINDEDMNQEGQENQNNQNNNYNENNENSENTGQNQNDNYNESNDNYNDGDDTVNNDDYNQNNENNQDNNNN